ncbi:hypothetical protein FA95DRAFT_95237 [Auriscalpium vulgare]|uniref:Uncharacterized protein n=1 Tax=Auriscalpium vulgare TaxID=40419 RepID=A0ACB8RNY6_9AGAM|nr:hypothetical protein FA95DRAFT_95237 [Auriscalpium vulgare]
MRYRSHQCTGQQASSSLACSVEIWSRYSRTSSEVRNLTHVECCVGKDNAQSVERAHTNGRIE